jgi:hypothetical protein
MGCVTTRLLERVTSMWAAYLHRGNERVERPCLDPILRRAIGFTAKRLPKV